MKECSCASDKFIHLALKRLTRQRTCGSAGKHSGARRPRLGEKLADGCLHAVSCASLPRLSTQADFSYSYRYQEAEGEEP